MGDKERTARRLYTYADSPEEKQALDLMAQARGYSNAAEWGISKVKDDIRNRNSKEFICAIESLLGVKPKSNLYYLIKARDEISR